MGAVGDGVRSRPARVALGRLGALPCQVANHATVVGAEREEGTGKRTPTRGRSGTAFENACVLTRAPVITSLAGSVALRRSGLSSDAGLHAALDLEVADLAAYVAGLVLVGAVSDSV